MYVVNIRKNRYTLQLLYCIKNLFHFTELPPEVTACTPLIPECSRVNKKQLCALPVLTDQCDLNSANNTPSGATAACLDSYLEHGVRSAVLCANSKDAEAQSKFASLPLASRNQTVKFPAVGDNMTVEIRPFLHGISTSDVPLLCTSSVTNNLSSRNLCDLSILKPGSGSSLRSSIKTNSTVKSKQCGVSFEDSSSNLTNIGELNIS